MAKKPINKICDKLTSVNDNFSITMYDNGFLIDIGGKNEEDEWRNAKIMVPTIEQLLELVKEAANMPRDE